MIWHWANGWLWISAGLVVALIELLLPGYLFIGTALALVAMGGLLLAGLWPGGLAGALVVTGLLSIAAWVLLRRLMGVQRDQVRIWDRDIND